MTFPDGAASDVTRPRVGAIVVAAGESRRMAGVDKVFASLRDRPLISYSLGALHDVPEIDDIVLVLSPQNLEQGRELVEASGWHKVREVRRGGDRRQDSVRNGLEALPDVEWVIVHDGARPFIDGELIARGLEEAARTGAAVAAVPVKDTIKSADSELLVTRTLPRDELWAAQTPQVFRKELLAEAHQRVAEDVTDDASMVERVGGKVRIFMGSYYNIKVTTPEDLTVAEAVLNARVSGESRAGQ